MRLPSVAWIALLGLVACHKVEENGRSEAASVITSKNLRSIWESSPNDVWVVGDKGTILHFDGHAWTRIPSGTEEDLSSVTGLGPTNIYISAQTGAILHWDGKEIHEVSGKEEPDAASTTLLHIWASGPNDVWAVGIGEGDDGGYLRKWNGTKWETQYIPGSSSLWGASGTGPGDVWMVGNSEKGDGFVLHGDGKHFDAIGYKGGQARSVWPYKPDDVWIAPANGPLQHWNGTAWTAVSPPDGSWCRIGGSGPDDIWAVGMDGVTWHKHADKWTQVPTGTNQIIWSVVSEGPNSAWAVGNNGTILRWNGSAWAQAKP